MGASGRSEQWLPLCTAARSCHSKFGVLYCWLRHGFKQFCVVAVLGLLYCRGLMKKGAPSRSKQRASRLAAMLRPIFW